MSNSIDVSSADTSSIDAAFEAAAEIQDAGWQAELDSGSHLIDAAIEAGNGNFGSAVAELAAAVSSSVESVQLYSEANHVMMEAAQEHIAEHSSISDWECVIL